MTNFNDSTFNVTVVDTGDDCRNILVNDRLVGSYDFGYGREHAQFEAVVDVLKKIVQGENGTFQYV